MNRTLCFMCSVHLWKQKTYRNNGPEPFQQAGPF
uniref:Uncharacterized protein n=1 Tax=Anguilla anguilla TaxID=7936 RepID=A0A0E9SN81_ANGAN